MRKADQQHTCACPPSRPTPSCTYLVAWDVAILRLSSNVGDRTGWFSLDGSCSYNSDIYTVSYAGEWCLKALSACTPKHGRWTGLEERAQPHAALGCTEVKPWMLTGKHLRFAYVLSLGPADDLQRSAQYEQWCQVAFD